MSLVDGIALAIPAYNAAHYLPRLFASVAAQTTLFDEIWVYDDCSSDNTDKVAVSFGAQVVRGEVNRGWCVGKNALLERTKCEWIHFHDADDLLNPEFAARARARIARESFDVLLFNFELIAEETGFQWLQTNFAQSTLLDDPLHYMLLHWVHQSCGVYSTSFLRRIGGFDTDAQVLYSEERAFNLRVVENGARFAIESYVGTRMFQRPNSTWEKDRVKCCIADHSVFKQFAQRHPGRYFETIADHCWQIAPFLACCLEWKTVDSCLSLACANGGRIPRNASLDFKIACAISPYLAMRLREYLVRLLKPQLRAGYPGWRFTLARPKTEARA